MAHERFENSTRGGVKVGEGLLQLAVVRDDAVKVAGLDTGAREPPVGLSDEAGLVCGGDGVVDEGAARHRELRRARGSAAQRAYGGTAQHGSRGRLERVSALLESRGGHSTRFESRGGQLFVLRRRLCDTDPIAFEMDARLARATEALLRALKKENPHIDEYPEAYLGHIATSLAKALAARHKPHDYAAAVRRVAYNLPQPHNHKTRLALCARTLPVEALGSESAWWASTERVKADARAARRRKRSIIVEERSGTTRVAASCPSCESKEACCLLFSRRTSHKAETWGAKDHEDSQVARLECCGCGRSWHDEDFAM